MVLFSLELVLFDAFLCMLNFGSGGADHQGTELSEVNFSLLKQTKVITSNCLLDIQISGREIQADQRKYQPEGALVVCISIIDILNFHWHRLRWRK